MIQSIIFILEYITNKLPVFFIFSIKLKDINIFYTYGNLLSSRKTGLILA
ncbi:hypothetical protein PROVRUST_07806 [Providencia rustigianii DSM 4541]|uniref:Uncharacterized protein n=1 Tax=Providencia rustigianii DSM 4541 TaxID=500637 RepID=D1P6K4_9GAMM|nr:hypothetical protein PROVRUST_07806 [Providencia rustigianii DSM 4541]